MSRDRRQVGNDRGMETVIAHVLSVGITTLLVIGLVASATGFLNVRSADAARNEVETIATRLAADLESADRLGTRSNGTTVRVTYPDSVAGRSYTTALVAANCNGDLASTEPCVRVEAAAHDASVLVPIQNDTRLALERGAGGRFRIISNGGTGERNTAGLTGRVSPRIGIADDLGVPDPETSTGFSQEPVPRFDVEPEFPEVGEQVEFDAIDSSDPDNSIAQYEWDLDDDGVFESAGLSPNWPGYPAGPTNVTLRVTDQSGISATLTKELGVTGLVISSPMTKTQNTGIHGFEFTVTNLYSDPVTMSGLLTDPADDARDVLGESKPNGLGPFDSEHHHTPHEVEVDIGPNGSVDFGFDKYRDSGSGGMSIPDDGMVNPIPNWGLAKVWGYSPPTLDPSESATITIQGFQTPIHGEEVTMGIMYHVANRTGTSRYTQTVHP